MLSALTHLLLPREKNDHRAHLLHPVSLFIFAFAFLSLQLFALLHPGWVEFARGADSITPQKIIEITNQKRIEQGLPALKEDSVLDKAALSKGADMISRNYWAHNAPDGTTPWHFFETAGYSYRYAGENLARDFSDPGDVVDAWIASPSHKENLFSSRYEEIGVAVVEGNLRGHNTILVVQMFGTKLSSVTAPQETPPVSTTGQKVVGLVQGESKTFLNGFGNWFSLTRSLGLFLLGFFAVAFLLDIIIVNARGVSRHASKSGAHVLFLLMVILAVLALKGGHIF